MADYKVGQILYIIPTKTANLVPVQVIERRISETTDGVIVKHIIRNPKPKGQPIILESVDGQVFTDLRMVRDMMVKNATVAIENMVTQAFNAAKQAFGLEKKVEMRDHVDITDYGSFVEQIPTHDAAKEQYDGHVADDDKMVEIMLPDGTLQKARVKSNS